MESIFARYNKYYVWSGLAILAAVISPAIGLANGLRCDQVFAAKAPLLTIQTSLGPIAIQGKVIETSNFSTDHKTNYLHLKLAAVLVPKDGIGHLFVIQRGDPNRAFDQLWRAALDRPRYFAKYEIFADENQLIVPDAIRLNIRNAGRIQFKDIPHTESQLYSNKDFEDALLKNTLLLASTENYFEHDRLQEHLMGAFALSNSAIRKVTEYIHFRRAFEKTSSKIDPNSFAGNKINYFTDISWVWDNLSNLMGKAVFALATAKGGVTASHISLVRDIVTKIDMDFSLENDRNLDYASAEAVKETRRPLTTLMAADVASSEFSSANKNRIISEIKKLEVQFLSAPMTEDQVMEETFRIIHEITEEPVSLLREMWKNSPKEFGTFI